MIPSLFHTAAPLITLTGNLPTEYTCYTMVIIVKWRATSVHSQRNYCGDEILLSHVDRMSDPLRRWVSVYSPPANEWHSHWADESVFTHPQRMSDTHTEQMSLCSLTPSEWVTLALSSLLINQRMRDTDSEQSVYSPPEHILRMQAFVLQSILVRESEHMTWDRANEYRQDQDYWDYEFRQNKDG